MNSNKYKETAKQFLMLAAGGESRKAFELFVSKDFKHHNIYFKGDAETIMLAMEENARLMPDKIFSIQRIIHENDLVAVHSHVKMNPKHPGYAVMHIFRFENEKVVEMWDFGQEVPEEMINENGMF